ncbi:hypothetical protein GIW32_25410, partial [Pseudomonas syringae]|nr:hypothetical protein [Pseudomonas syringae]
MDPRVTPAKNLQCGRQQVAGERWHGSDRNPAHLQGEALAQTDANGNVQRFSYGAAGQLHAVELTLTNTE